MPPRFFITHSWNDIEFAKQFTDAMRASRLEGFFDAYSLSPGDVITAEIQKGLEACDVYVPILSDAALRSPWCEEEINAAITLSKLPGRNGRPRIIPVLIEPVQDRMSIFLRARLFVRFEDNFQASFQEFWRGVMAAPTQDSPIIPKPPPQSPARETAPSSSQPAPQAPIPAPAPTRAEPPASAPKLETPPRVTVSLPRDEIMMLYQDGRAHQNAGDLTDARAAFQKVYDSDPNYRDVSARLTKLDLYLNAQELMAQGVADQEDKLVYWEQAAARLDALLQLDARFLDTAEKLETAKRWIALDEAYERLQDALEDDDWASAFARFQQIQSVKPTYRNTPKLFTRNFGEIVRAGLTKRIFEPDGKEMLLIGAGAFLRGSDGIDNAKPERMIHLDAFYIDRFPVTNAEYKKFVDATQREAPYVEADWAKPYNWVKSKRTFPPDKANHPVVLVSWEDASAYAQWAGKRLPTEAEWEKAASWDFSQNKKRLYPWGDAFDSARCNTQEAGLGGTSPVTKYVPQGDSMYGVADMAGNVWEWCADWFDENYYKGSPRENPQGPASGQYRVLRGGSFGYEASDARCARRSRNPPVDLSLYAVIGFRVVAAPVRL